MKWWEIVEMEIGIGIDLICYLRHWYYFLDHCREMHKSVVFKILWMDGWVVVEVEGAWPQYYKKNPGYGPGG